MLGVEDRLVAFVLDDALAIRALAHDPKGQPPPGQRFASDEDYDDGDWKPPSVPEALATTVRAAHGIDDD